MTPPLVPMAEAQASPSARAAPAVRAPLADGVYAALKSELSDFRWIPGDRFSETEIGQRLGVSRTPVREALFRLRNEGFLDVEPKAGWFVRPIDFHQLDQFYELRVVLELASIDRLIAHAGPQPMLDALKAAWLVAPPERLSDARTLAALDEQFHATLVAAAGNPEITRVHREVTQRIRIVRRLDFTRADRVDATYLEHGKILRAVMQRKAGPARLMIRSHIEQSRSEVRKITLHTLHEARRGGPRR